MGPNVRGALFALAGFAIFATHDIFIKILGGTYSPIQIVFFSALLSFPLATLMLIRDAQPGTLLPRHPYWMAVRSVAVVITAISAFYAFSVLPLAQVYAILFAAPLLITILAIPILGENVRLRRWLAVLVGLVGVMVVLQPGAQPLTAGHVAALLAAVGGALGSVIVRKIGREERPAVLLLYPMLVNVLVMGIGLYFVYEPMPLRDLGMLALIALLAWFAMRFMIAAYKAGEAAIVSPMQYSQIIWASIFGALIFGEGIEGATILGAAIIIASGLYIVFREARISTNSPVTETRSRAETGTSLRVGPLIDARARRRVEDDGTPPED